MGSVAVKKDGVEVGRAASQAMHELGERIAVAAAHLDAAMHRLLADLRAFDEGGGWYAQGALSAAHWLSWRVGWTLATAREHVRVARALGTLPLIDDALRQGRLSYSKIRAITRVATPATEAALLTDALATTASQLETICRKLRTVQQIAAQRPDDIAARRTIVRRTLEDGMVRIEVTMCPDEAATVWTALEHEAKRASDTRLDRVDGLVAMSQAALRGTSPDRAPVEVVLTVPAAALRTPATPATSEGAAAGDPAALDDAIAVFQDGTCVSAETSRRLACDAAVVQVVEDPDGKPLSVGRARRTIPAALKRALSHRDGTCRFPGCSNRLYLDGHHLRHWADGGETGLDNLCLLCRRHHTFVHEHGYRIESRDGQLTFLDARGRPVPAEAPRPPCRLDPVAAIVAANRRGGIEIMARTNASAWDGRPLQYDHVIGALWRLERTATA